MMDYTNEERKMRWFTTYHMTVDEILAQPTDMNPGAAEALKRGIVKEISYQDGDAMNAQFEQKGEWAKVYLADHFKTLRAAMAKRAAERAAA